MSEHVFVRRVVRLPSLGEKDYKEYCVDNEEVVIYSGYNENIFTFLSGGKIQQISLPEYFVLRHTMYVFRYNFTGRDFLIKQIKNNSTRYIIDVFEELLRLIPDKDIELKDEYIRQSKKFEELRKSYNNIWSYLILSNVIWFCILYWRW